MGGAMYRHYKHKRHLNLFLFHQEGAPMKDASEDLAGIHNWHYLADIASIEDIPEQLRKPVLERGYCMYTQTASGAVVLI
jgi:hypothetical protein